MIIKIMDGEATLMAFVKIDAGTYKEFVMDNRRGGVAAEATRTAAEVAQKIKAAKEAGRVVVHF